MKSKLLILFIILCGIAKAQGTWSSKAPFPNKASFITAFSIGNKGYFVCGAYSAANPRNYVDTICLWEWDPLINIWTKKADFPGTARDAAIGFSIGSKGYLGTGEHWNGVKSVFFKDFWEYNPATDNWTRKADFAGSARQLAVGFSIGNKGYIGTGADSAGKLCRDFWEWDQTTDQWTRKADFAGTPRDIALGFAIGTKGYIGTGYDSTNNYKKDFWEWNQSTDTWVQKADFGGTARWGAVGFVIGSNGYISTGGQSNPLYKDLWMYNTLADTWSMKTDFKGGARYFAASFSIDNKGYIGTGDSLNSKKYQDFWEYCDTCSIPTAVSEITLLGFSMSIFPNPFYSSTTIRFNKPIINSELYIYNVYGQNIKTIKSISGQEIKLDRVALPTGIYFIRLTHDNKVIASDKIVISD